MHHWIIIAAAIVLALAAVQDIASLRIANLFPVLMVALYAVWVAMVGWNGSLWLNAASFLAMLGVGIIMFGRGWLGGGDVKLLAATALWFPLAGLPALIAYVTMIGGLMTLVLIALRRVVMSGSGDQIRNPVLKPKGPIPYGVAIAVGAIACLFLYGPNPDGVAREPAFLRGAGPLGQSR